MELKIETQPDDESCGPTCLHAIYRHYGYNIPIEEVIETIDRSPSGGTFCICIGKHALQHGFKSTIYINSPVIFDPSWFVNGEAENQFLIDKLKAQNTAKVNPYINAATAPIVEYLELGGKICSYPISAELLKQFFDNNIPVISGLCSTVLYGSIREFFTEDGKSIYDDVRGSPCGHFVVLIGYDTKKEHVIIADPYTKNPLHQSSYYKVNIHQLINAILLGVITFDGNLTVIEPKN